VLARRGGCINRSPPSVTESRKTGRNENDGGLFARTRKVNGNTKKVRVECDECCLAQRRREGASGRCRGEKKTTPRNLGLVTRPAPFYFLVSLTSLQTSIRGKVGRIPQITITAPSHFTHCPFISPRLYCRPYLPYWGRTSC